MHTSEEVQDTPAAQQVVQSVSVSSSIVDVTPTPAEPKPRKKKEAEAIAIVEPPAPAAPEPTPEIVETAPLAPAPIIPPAPVPAPEPELETVEGTLASAGITYEQLVKLVIDLKWWENPEAYPTVADLPPDICNWIIRNKRGIGRAVVKAGGAL
jgi:hypothetical protein